MNYVGYLSTRMTVLSCGLLNGGWVGGMKGVVQCALKARYNFICTH